MKAGLITLLVAAGLLGVAGHRVGRGAGRADRRGAGPGDGGSGLPDLPGCPVRGAAGRPAAVAAAGPGAAVDGAARRDEAGRPVRADRRRRKAERAGGLPLPHRHRAGRAVAAAAARAGLAARRRQHLRHRERLRHPPARRRRRCCGRLPELPAFALQQLRAPGTRRGRRLRPARPAGRASLGQAQRGRVRRRPGQRHADRRVRRRVRRLRSADLAVGARAVPAGDPAQRLVLDVVAGERHDRHPGRAARAVAFESGSRHERGGAGGRARLHRPRDRRGLPAPGPGRGPARRRPAQRPDHAARVRHADVAPAPGSAHWPTETSTACRCSPAPRTTRRG